MRKRYAVIEQETSSDLAVTGSTLFSGELFLEAAQIWRELAPHYFLADCFGGSSDLVGTGSTLFSGGLVLEAAQIWRELAFFQVVI
jgi:hypothetical protein